MAKITAKKRILIASILVGILVLGAIVSIVLVLAAQNQRITTNVSIKYVVDGVGAKVSASYAMIPMSEEIIPSRVAMKDGGESEQIEFEVKEQTTSKVIAPKNDLVLDPENQRIVFEYAFTNTSSAPFTVGLTYEDKVSENMIETFRVSNRRLDDSELRVNFSEETLNSQAVIEENKTLYIYASVQVQDENIGAIFEADFVWSLLKADTINVKLNHNGGSSSASSIKAIADANMPIIGTLPTLSGKTFGGYYVGETQYINSVGTGVRVCDLEDGATLTAKWTEEKIVIDNGTLTKLTSLGEDETEIVIPETITYIAEGAFDNASNLETLTFGDATAAYADSTNKLTIGKRVFEGCTNITKVYLNTSNINDLSETTEAFYKSGREGSGIELIVGKNVKKIPHYFMFTQGVVYYDGVTPTYLDVYPNLTKITFEEDSILKTIGIRAFEHCWGLKEVEIPASVTRLYHHCFYWNELENVTFAQNSRIKVIEKSSFSGCGTITSIKIPESLEELHRAAFIRCDQLVNVEFENDCPNLKVMESQIFESCKALEEIKLPDSLTKLDEFIFNHCENLNKVILPKNLKSIHQNLFINCPNLKTIEIPNTVTEIQVNAFRYCTALESITIPENVKVIDRYAFNGCTSLKSITLPKGLEKLGSYVFSESGLETLTLPSSLTVIPDRMCHTCTSLTTVVIPTTITEIGQAAFYSCASANYYYEGSRSEWDNITIYYANENQKYNTIRVANMYHFSPNGSPSEVGNTFTYNSSNEIEIVFNSYTISSDTINGGYSIKPSKTEGITETLVLPSEYSGTSGVKQVTAISSSAFKDNTTIKNIILPKNIAFIGENAFSGCTNLQYNTYGNATYLGTLNNDYAAFIKMTDTTLEAIEINQKTRVIYDDALRNSKLKTIIIPASVMQLGKTVFSNCKQLTEIIFEENSKLNSIGQYVFSTCTGLSEIKLPSSLKDIKSYAFNGCNGLEYLLIPASVTNISAKIFNALTNPSFIAFCQAKSQPAGWATNWNYVNDSTNATIIWDFDDDDVIFETLIETDVNEDYEGTANVIIISESVKVIRECCLDNENIKAVIFENKNDWKVYYWHTQESQQWARICELTVDELNNPTQNAERFRAYDFDTGWNDLVILCCDYSEISDENV